MIRLDHISFVIFGVILISVSGMVMVYPDHIDNHATEGTIKSNDLGTEVSLKNINGAFNFKKSDGSISINEKDSDNKKLINSYSIDVYELNTQLGWKKHNLNNNNCIWEVSHIEFITHVACYKSDDDGFVIIKYSLTDSGVLVLAEFQGNDKTKDGTHYFKFVETIQGNIEFFDGGLELFSINGFTFNPTTINTKLVEKSDMTIQGNTITTEYITTEPLSFGHVISFERNFDY